MAPEPLVECCCHPVAFMMAAIVAPVGDCSIAMTRACFERASALLVLGSSAGWPAAFAALTDNGDFADDGFLADLDIEILHSAHDGLAVAPPKPRISDKGQDLGAPLAPQI